jgi:hypothetical protein
MVRPGLWKADIVAEMEAGGKGPQYWFRQTVDTVSRGA